MTGVQRALAPPVVLSGLGGAEAFFAEVVAGLPASTAAAVVVTHLLPGQMDFLAAFEHVAQVVAVLPKPKSADLRIRKQVEAVHRCDVLDRARFTDPLWLTAYLEDRAAGRRLVLADIGGYFAPALAELCGTFSGQIAGVVEDTENGLRRYLQLDPLPCPVYSVARSPLKEPEDRLVGEAIVFSIESLLRRMGEILPGRRACVLGFGKIGSGVAAALHARHVVVTVRDTDPVRQAQAIAAGFHSMPLPEALSGADLVVSATGRHAIGMEHLPLLREGAFLAGATSGDDEFDLGSLTGETSGFIRQDVIDGVVRYGRQGRAFFLLGNGNAVNFLHTSAMGPAIHLVKAEIVAAAARLLSEPHEPALYEVPARTRARIAAAWVDKFRRPADAVRSPFDGRERNK
ncbi:adenosylhomocysteinase [Sphaerisporangium rufum]|uniref:Adenosylhomocysteinase n=1 Tax=Sphaerisporangium rufum TaxID=1381558 RepID=A0A919UYV3_9ACTN|nr:adenosylhomocysteinase [Sphaerisporangium rufum]GII78431.1 adenosylhomocysteinase [Sphaerisporangium rufum]